MVPKKLVSIRLDTDLIKKIDDVASSRRYLTRSGVINRVLQHVFDSDEDDYLFRIIRGY